MTESPKLLPCPFCGSKPSKGMTPKRGCQMHGDPMQYIVISCGNNKCHSKPSVKGNVCRYNGGDDPKYHKEATENAISVWNTRATSPQPDVEPCCEIDVNETVWHDKYHSLCEQCWKAMGITEYTGKSIPEHISEIAFHLSGVAPEKVEGLDEAERIVAFPDEDREVIEFKEKYRRWPLDVVREAARRYARSEPSITLAQLKALAEGMKKPWKPVSHHEDVDDYMRMKEAKVFNSGIDALYKAAEKAVG